MSTRKPGYAPLLLLTKLFTLAGTALLVIGYTRFWFAKSLTTPALFAVVITPFALSAVTCIVRKRFFTVSEQG